MGIRTKKAKKVLTKAEQQHLTEMNVHSFREFREAREHQIKKTTQGMAEACWECKGIARKLGIE